MKYVFLVWYLKCHLIEFYIFYFPFFCIDDDSGEKSVSVLLSGEESELTFIDHAYADMTVGFLWKFPNIQFLINFIIFFKQPENCISSYDPHGFCVIYSSSDRSTFLVAERILQTLWMSENIAQKAVILVGNKADLARCRMVTTEGWFNF
jgi:Rad/Gem-related GTP binding protein 1